MKKYNRQLAECFIVVGLLLTVGVYYGFADHILKDKERWKVYYREVSPLRAVNKWVLPFETVNRSDINTIRVVSVFGAKRFSYVRGHFHTGMDLVPRKKNGEYTYVYGMAPGIVCSIHLADPHQTVVVKHKLSSGEILFTSYKHLQDIYVQNGQQITPETKIGRLYTRQEALKLGGNYDHLHLEIRKKFDDYGVASWATLTKDDLNLRFMDPLKFLKRKIKM